MSTQPTYSVSDFVAVCNQVLDVAFGGTVTVVGELANFRVSKNRWVYFDLKDEESSVRCFGSVYQLAGVVEDGMMVQIEATPRLHTQFGFSLTFQTIKPVGEGSIKRASALLEAKLKAEGLFDESRKRSLLYPPTSIGLIASAESAAYHDFIKILNARWGGVNVHLVDTQVQGEAAPAQIVSALEHLNSHTTLDCIVITRGGGSAEDMSAFSTEAVTRAVATSRIPTLVAIGHEVDVSLAELAADRRASTPSNAAEILVPDKVHLVTQFKDLRVSLKNLLQSQLQNSISSLEVQKQILRTAVQNSLEAADRILQEKRQLLVALHPEAPLRRGYAIVTNADGNTVTSIKQLAIAEEMHIRFHDGRASATVIETTLQ